MPATLPVRPAMAALCLAVLAAGGSLAADTPPADPAAASAAYLATFRQAVPDGWLQSEFKAWNDAGQETSLQKGPECTSPDQRGELPDRFEQMLGVLSSVGNCKVTAYEPGTLRFAMNCAEGPDGQTFSYDSAGTFVPGKIDLTIRLKATGPEAPDLGSMHFTAERLRACTAAELAASVTQPASGS